MTDTPSIRYAAAAEEEIERLRLELAAALAEVERQRMFWAGIRDARVDAAERERDAARAQISEWNAKLRAAEHDGGGECSYCHGVGACPRCWGRAGIERRTAERDEAREALGWCLDAVDCVCERTHEPPCYVCRARAALAKGER